MTGGKLQIIPRIAQIVPVFDFKNWAPSANKIKEI
jgi:hypothetical protein